MTEHHDVRPDGWSLAHEVLCRLPRTWPGAQLRELAHDIKVDISQVRLGIARLNEMRLVAIIGNDEYGRPSAWLSSDCWTEAQRVGGEYLEGLKG